MDLLQSVAFCNGAVRTIGLIFCWFFAILFIDLFGAIEMVCMAICLSRVCDSNDERKPD